MPASSMEVYLLMQQMHTALIDLCMGKPRHVVAEAVTRTAAAIVGGAAPVGQASNLLLIAATVFVERAKAQPEVAGRTGPVPEPPPPAA